MVAASGATLVVAHVERALGLLDLGCGRPAAALDRLLVAIAAARYESHPLFVLALPDAVEAAVRADRLCEVAEHLDRFETWVQQFPNPARLALLARCRALVGESDAGRHFTQAIELAEACSPFDRARTELSYGEWLRRQHRRVDARRHLRTALELFEQLAVSPWEARARSELRASGETARKRDPSTRDQLTPQELQISRLVAVREDQPGGCRAAVPQPAHDRLPPAQGLRQARDRLPRGPRGRGPRRAGSRLTGDFTGAGAVAFSLALSDGSTSDGDRAAARSWALIVCSAAVTARARPPSRRSPGEALTVA